MLVALLAGAAMALDCPQHLTREDLLTQIDQAETAYAELDTNRFRDRMNELAGLLLPCIGDLVPPDLAARAHRLMALQQLELGNEAAAEGSLTAAKAISSDVAIPDAWLPTDHPLRAAWSAAEPPAMSKAPEPRIGTLAFDGVSGRDRPKGVPTVAQVFDPSGVALSTAYLGADDPLPTYAAIPRTRNWLIGSAAGSGATGAALLALSWLQYRAVLASAADPNAPATDLDRGRGTTNALYVAGGGLLGVGVGLGIGAVAIGQR